MSSLATPASPGTSRTTQYTVLNAALEKLQKNLSALEQNVEVTVVQSEWTKRLLTIHSSLMMASSKVLHEDMDQGEDGSGQHGGESSDERHDGYES
ncbi:hypothetical protein BGZ83_007873 [Gryganskiella cystojenkinii]|nr:hypothetical protein BGZ83_007873 [Gryganskiella cystojenkinii]